MQRIFEAASHYIYHKNLLYLTYFHHSEKGIKTAIAVGEV